MILKDKFSFPPRRTNLHLLTLDYKKHTPCNNLDSPHIESGNTTRHRGDLFTMYAQIREHLANRNWLNLLNTTPEEFDYLKEHLPHHIPTLPFSRPVYLSQPDLYIHPLYQEANTLVVDQHLNPNDLHNTLNKLHNIHCLIFFTEHHFKLFEAFKPTSQPFPQITHIQTHTKERSFDMFGYFPNLQGLFIPHLKGLCTQPTLHHLTHLQVNCLDTYIQPDPSNPEAFRGVYYPNLKHIQTLVLITNGDTLLDHFPQLETITVTDPTDQYKLKTFNRDQIPLIERAWDDTFQEDDPYHYDLFFSNQPLELPQSFVEQVRPYVSTHLGQRQQLYTCNIILHHTIPYALHPCHFRHDPFQIHNTLTHLPLRPPPSQ